MPKVLLVEDDNNLREIFEMRLQAEGYDTVTAGDGEEGLAVAVKEKPDLVIADVMMPRLSGFEMVENLRATPEMKDTKVIMMTALGQAEDMTRGEKLGVVKYLVKSQVTLEDFVRVVREVLPSDQGTPGAVKPEVPDDSAKTKQASNNKQESENQQMPEDNQTNPASQPAPDNSAPADGAAAPGSNPISGAPSLDSSVSGGAQSTEQEQGDVQNQINNFASSDPAAPAPDSGSTDPAAPAADPSAPAGDVPAEQGDVPVTPPPAPSDPATPPAPEAPASDQPAGGDSSASSGGDTTSPAASGSL